MDFRIITQDEREALYKEVWEEPVVTVAKRYDLSDNGLRKHCIRLGIPLPYSGYWARIRAGEKIAKPALPKVTGELKEYIRNYVIKYKTDIDQLTDEELISGEELNLLRDETKIFIKEFCSQIKVNAQLRNPHKLITDHKEEVKQRQKRDKALSKVSPRSKRYEAIKSKFHDNKFILPIHVSDANIDRAYRIIDTFIKTIDEIEGWTKLSGSSGKDGAYFVVLHASFEFELSEKTIKGRASKVDNEVCHKLVLYLRASSWLSDKYFGALEYGDQENEALESQIGKIIYDMVAVGNKVNTLYELEKREHKREQEEYRRQRLLEEMRSGELSEIKLLEQAAVDWDKAERIRRFADSMELKISEVKDAGKKKMLFEWLKWARDKADWLDPLIAKEDELLGKNKHIFEAIEEEFEST